MVHPELESLLCRKSESMNGEVEARIQDKATEVALGSSVDADVLRLQKMLELLLRIEEYDAFLSNELAQEVDSSREIRINRTKEAPAWVSKAVEETGRKDTSKPVEGASFKCFPLVVLSLVQNCGFECQVLPLLHSFGILPVLWGEIPDARLCLCF